MKYFFIVITVFFASCIDPITLDNDNEVNILVVEGNITTEYGPHKVKLTRSAKYGDIFEGVIEYEQNADVFIRDDLGNTIKLLGAEYGEYYTSEDFIGVIGRSYTLIVELTDGIVYQSIPDTLVAVPNIDSIYYVFQETPVSSDDGVEFISGVNLYVEYNDPEDASNYYRWDTEGTYLFHANPELYTPTGSPNPVPKDCCSECFMDESINTLSVSSDRLYDGANYGENILFVKDDGARFYDKYSVEISQKSISREAYEYFNLLINQNSINGDIFDPPPATIRGNMVNLSNPDENVVGYFYVSDIKRVRKDIFGYDLPYLVQPSVIPDDCREVLGAYFDAPEFW